MIKINNYWNKIKEWNKNNKSLLWSGIGGVTITLIITVTITIYSNGDKLSTVKNKIIISGNNLQSTSGDVNINTGNGNINKTVNKTIIQGIPNKEYLRLAKELGVTENAVKNFFKIIQQKEIPKEDWYTTLRKIATRHKELQSRLKQFNLLVDPEIEELRLKSEEAITNGDYNKAVKYLDEIINKQLICADRLLKESINCKLLAAESKVDKGDIELIRINYKSAIKLFKEAVELVPNEHELKKAEYLQKMGDAARDSGLYSEAQTALDQCLEIREKLLPIDDIKIAISLNSLALLYRSQDKYEDAEALLKRSLGIFEKALGKVHPDVAIALINLASVYKSQGKYEEAEPLFQRSISIMKKIISNYPNLASSLNYLKVLTAYLQGKYEETEPLLQRVLHYVEKKLGKDHPEVAELLNNLASLYLYQGKYEKAEPLYERALEINETKLGKDHPNVATTLNKLAELYMSQDKYEKAEPLLHRSLGIREKKFGKDHSIIVPSIIDLAFIYSAKNPGENPNSISTQYCKRGLAIYEKVFGIENQKYIDILYRCIQINTEHFGKMYSFPNWDEGIAKNIAFKLLIKAGHYESSQSFEYKALKFKNKLLKKYVIFIAIEAGSNLYMSAFLFTNTPSDNYCLEAYSFDLGFTRYIDPDSVKIEQIGKDNYVLVVNSSAFAQGCSSKGISLYSLSYKLFKKVYSCYSFGCYDGNYPDEFRTYKFIQEVNKKFYTILETEVIDEKKYFTYNFDWKQSKYTKVKTETVRQSEPAEENEKEPLTIDEDPKPALSISDKKTSRQSTPLNGGKTTLERKNVQQMLKDTNQLNSQIRIRPHFSRGRPDGLSVNNIKQDSFFRKMGMRNGDIIKDINGKKMKTVDDVMYLFEQLKTANEIVHTIRRRGKLMKLHILISE